MCSVTKHDLDKNSIKDRCARSWYYTFLLKMTSDEHHIIVGRNLHEISFKNNINTLANKSHLQKLGHFVSHNDYLTMPLVMT
jgi:hypothetical protein